jgi:hypothetical protein
MIATIASQSVTEILENISADQHEVVFLQGYTYVRGLLEIREDEDYLYYLIIPYGNNEDRPSSYIEFNAEDIRGIQANTDRHLRSEDDHWEATGKETEYKSYR